MPFLPFIPFANCAEIVCQGLMAGQAAYLTTGWLKPGGINSGDLQGLADEMAAWLISDLAPIQQAGITWNSVQATDLNTGSSPVAFSTAGLPVAGGVSGAALTNQVAMVISFKTVKRGRSYRGRNYVPSIPPGSIVSTTQWTAAALTAYGTAYQNMAAAMALIGWTWVVLSRQIDGVRRTVGAAEPVTSHIPRAAIGTQRRRIIGHGI